MQNRWGGGRVGGYAHEDSYEEAEEGRFFKAQLRNLRVSLNLSTEVATANQTAGESTAEATSAPPITSKDVPPPPPRRQRSRCLLTSDLSHYVAPESIISSRLDKGSP